MKKITLLFFLFMSTFWSHAQVNSYSFAQTSGTYTEITGGTALGAETSDAQRFVDPAVPLGGTTLTGVGFPIGFNFTYNGYVYDRFAVCNDGWISLGSSALTPAVNVTTTSLYAPLSSVSVITPLELSAKISILAKDLQGQVGSTLRFETIGVAPNRVLVIQWKNYRKYAAVGDSFNCQIRLNETTNVVDIVYGAFTSNATASANYQVGLRAEPAITATNYASRKSSTGWGVTTPATIATDVVLMNDVLIPSNGLTFTWTPPACGGAINLVTSAITTSGANLAWSSALPTPVGYEYVVSSSTSFPIGSGTPTTNLTETVSGLNPNTVYNVFMRSNCGTEYTSWILLGNFKTKCLDEVSIYESFDTYTAVGTIMPDCWVKAGNGTAYINSGGAAPGSAPNRLYMFANGSGATPTVAYAILPSLSNLQAGTHRLRFEAYATSASRFLDIGYFTDSSDLSTFNIIETFALPSTAASTALEFISTPLVGQIPVGVKNLVFRNAAIPTASTTLYIDDVAWEPIPTCPDVTALTFDGMTSSTVNVAWTAGGSETAWQYVVGASTVTNPNTLTAVDVTSAAITIPGLTAATTYKVWVRSNCGTTSLGAWIGPVVFATTCTSVTTFSQNFDYGTTPPLPSCWTKIGIVNNSYTVAYTSAASAPNSLYTYSTSTSQSVTALPPVSNSGAGTHRLRFKYRGTTANVVLQVGYLLNIADPASFIPLLDFVATNTTSWFNESAVLGMDPTTPNLAFRNLGTPSGTIYIDDVLWEPIPTCLDVTALALIGVNSTSADLTWTPGGAETSWQYAIGASTLADPSTLTPVTVANSTINIGSLTPATSYKVWVRSFCSASDLGAWMGPISVTTTCTPVTGFTQNFDSGTTFAACWSKVGTIGSAYPTSTTGAPSAPNALYMFGSTATPAVVAMQPASNTAAGTHRLKFKFRGSAVGAVLEVGYLSNPLDATSFMPLTSFVATSNTVYDNISAELGTEPLSQVLAFRKSGTSNGVYIDDIIWEPIPTCLDVSAVAVSGITSATATVNWIAGGSETSWQYAYGPATLTNPSTLTPVLVNATTTALSVLTPNTAYKVWVRSYCSATDLGAWVGPVTFATTCAPVTEFTQNFDSGTTFAPCWSKVGTLGSAYPTSTAGAPSAPNTLYMYSGTATAQAVVAMQPASNTSAGTHRLKFKFRGSVVGVNLEVGYLDNPTDASTFVPLQTYTATSTTVYDVVSAELGTAPLSQVLAFRSVGVPSGAVYIDDVAWELIPATIPVCATGITAVPNATCGNFATAISWAAAIGADSYKLTIGTTASGTEIFNNQDIGGGLSYSFSGNFNTTYYYKITPFNSIGDAVGCTEQSFVTAVNGCVCTSLPTTVDGLGITNALINSTNFVNTPIPPATVNTYNSFVTNIDMPQALNANVQLSFSTLTYDYHTNIWIDFNNNLTFEPTEIVYTGVSSSTSPNVLDASFVVSATAPLGVHRMRIVATDTQQVPANPCYSASYGVTLDFTSVTIIAPPTCLPATGLTVNSSTSSTASISWLAPSPAPAMGYDYYYSTSNTVPTATTTPSGSVGAGITTTSLSGLTPATVYYVWVRSVCSATDLSPWSPPVTFTTACVSATAPYSQNFETATVPAMPLCSTTENAGTGNNWTTAANPGYGFTSKVLQYQWNGSNAANAWYYTQPVTLTAGTSYDISYKYGNNSTTYIEKLKVAYGTSASASAMTTVLADYPNVTGAVATPATVSFTPTVSGDYYFGFNAYSVANQFYLFVDDIMVQTTLATNTFDNNGFTYYPNPVKDVLNLGYDQEITNVSVFNLLGQQVITKAVNANQSKIDMSNLSKGTYMVKITADNQVKTIKVIKE